MDGSRQSDANLLWWREVDSNHRRRKPADLQSAPVGRLGIPPESCLKTCVLRDACVRELETPGILPFASTGPTLRVVQIRSRRICRTTEGVSQQIYGLPPLAAWVSLQQRTRIVWTGPQTVNTSWRQIRVPERIS